MGHSQGSNGSAKSCITDVEELVARKACVTGAKERVADSLAWRFVPAILACSSIVSRLWRCTKHIDVAILTVLVLRKTVMNKMTTTNGNEEDS
ncbi:hypothetical protein Peur_066577 [Populus x canadensis]